MRGDTIVFTRPLGIKRNAVVLPKGYELISSSFPSQVLQETDGRIGISFWNNTPVRSRGDAARASDPRSAADPRRSPRALASARTRIERSCIFSSRPRRTRSICITTTPSHAWESGRTSTRCARAARSRIRVRRISTPARSSSGRSSKASAITAAKLDVANVTPQIEIVVFRFAPVKQGESVRIRMFETYTDTARYKVVGNELIWDRSFGRPRTPSCCRRVGC